MYFRTFIEFLQCLNKTVVSSIYSSLNFKAQNVFI